MRDLNVNTDFFTCTVTLSNFCNLLNRLQTTTSLIPLLLVDNNKLWVRLWYFTISMAHSPRIVISSPLSSNKIWVNQFGPCLQSKLIFSSFGETPQKEMLAGLSFPGQWVSVFGWHYPQISFTLMWTNGFHSLPSPWNQNNTTFESVKHDPSLTLMTDSSAASTWVMSLANRKEQRNSSRRIVLVCWLHGDTVVFDTTKCACSDPTQM